MKFSLSNSRDLVKYQQLSDTRTHTIERLVKLALRKSVYCADYRLPEFFSLWPPLLRERERDFMHFSKRFLNRGVSFVTLDGQARYYNNVDA